MYEISITDTATPMLEDLDESLRTRLAAVLGKRAEVLLRAHFDERNQEPNKMNWPKQNFWNRIRRATALAGYDDTSATVAIADRAIAQKIFGGPIVPRNVKNLALPAQAAAYAAGSPREGATPLLRFAFAKDPETGKMRPALVADEPLMKEVGKKRKDGTRRKKEIAPAGIWYWLVKKVSQAADPRALPDEQSMLNVLLDGTRAFIERKAS